MILFKKNFIVARDKIEKTKNSALFLWKMGFIQIGWNPATDSSRYASQKLLLPQVNPICYFQLRVLTHSSQNFGKRNLEKVTKRSSTNKNLVGLIFRPCSPWNNFYGKWNGIPILNYFKKLKLLKKKRSVTLAFSETVNILWMTLIQRIL